MLKAKPDPRFAQFLASYPVPRRKAGEPTRHAFQCAVQKVPFAVMLHALEQHKRSVQWQDPRFIPSMTTWLDEERWIQTLPETTPLRLSKADLAQRLRSLSPQAQARRAGLK